MIPLDSWLIHIEKHNSELTESFPESSFARVDLKMLQSNGRWHEVQAVQGDEGILIFGSQLRILDRSLDILS